ncbi:UDP-N-acetylmuramoyl-L-alanyl-D-glutamate--2,6-diaminopimelate ligase [Wukongibacter baidiensis]|uniref:UDP-N-acetylmuramoyl-L-alanyl-D-glutamate--2, 6-diaminopimelate ligase n=1 Tax=Wukongibacter baidiensis TaxID=1723361 RepID=UPI003D7F9286
MKLEELIKQLNNVEVKGSIDILVKGIAYNSNCVKEDYIFVAIEGLKLDGHRYIDDAISKGAKVIIVSKDIEALPDATIIRVKDTRKTLSCLAAYFYGNPSEKIKLIGVTGTNGKTTTAHFLKSILDTPDREVGLIGTLGTIIKGKCFCSTHTTPESLELQRIFKLMIDENVETCIVEVSSHSIQLDRIRDCDFDIGIFTNLTHEHLDFHKDMENYYNVKKQLFLKANSLNIINIDDRFGKRLTGEVVDIGTPLLTYGIEDRADIFATEISLFDYHSKFSLNTPRGKIDIKINIPGMFNIYNSLAAAAFGYILGLELECIKKGLESLRSIPGRFEIVPTNKNFNVIIDYAHTPDGFHKILETISKSAKGRIVMVFGCVGERDQTKRSKMGNIAAQYCDLAVLTTDNCRSENPQKIINEIKKGLRETNGRYIEILNREEAIRYAILNSKENDTILITGKGHERKQIIGEHVMYFNEKEIIARALEELSRN